MADARFGKDYCRQSSNGLVWRGYFQTADGNGIQIDPEDRGAAPIIVLPDGQICGARALGLVRAASGDPEGRGRRDTSCFRRRPAHEGRVGTSKIPQNQIRSRLQAGSPVEFGERASLVTTSPPAMSRCCGGGLYIISTTATPIPWCARDIRVQDGKADRCHHHPSRGGHTIKLGERRGGEALAKTACS